MKAEIQDLNECVTSMSSINCVDLFAGAGGFTQAAMDIGMQVIAAVENDVHACNTYFRNFISGKKYKPSLYRRDIYGLPPSTLYLGHFAGRRECDIVLGGPPCQGFSVHRIKGSGVGDPRNNLIHRYFEYVHTLQSKLFLMENVPGMLWPRHKEYLETFYAEGEAAGYRIHAPITLDARDYGVPQRRKRVFILGVRKDLPDPVVWPPVPSHGSKNARMQDSDLKKWRNSRSVFRKAHLGDPNDRHMNHTQELIKVFKNTRLHGGNRTKRLKCHQDHDGHKDVYGRIDPRRPGPTMTTACINPSKGRFVHPEEPHGITIRQAARFQTFPDNFVFEGGLMAAGKQVGNAVPVRLGRALLYELGKFLTLIHK